MIMGEGAPDAGITSEENLRRVISLNPDGILINDITELTRFL